MGIRTQSEKNRMVITGGKPAPAVIDSKGDHRIAMAFSLLGTIAGETVINDAECVAKTWPEYWDVFKNLGGKVLFNGK
jgi:3-phosphoshikimate 1-carboxyvinyltransferase